MDLRSDSDKNDVESLGENDSVTVAERNKNENDDVPVCDVLLAYREPDTVCDGVRDLAPDGDAVVDGAVDFERDIELPLMLCCALGDGVAGNVSVVVCRIVGLTADGVHVQVSDNDALRDGWRMLAEMASDGV